ncbi:MAG: 2-oxo acid dehydrogenase subunit E2 [Candidatus Thermoplasmatota archaeon]
MDRLGSYKVKPFTKERKDISIILSENSRKHAFKLLIEPDITESKQKIEKIKNEGKKDISFTSWIIKCYAEALSENKNLNSYRSGNKLYIFDDVDVSVPVERSFKDKQKTMIYLVRKANEKTTLEITREIRKVQKEEITEKKEVLGKKLTLTERIVLNSPSVIKKIFLMVTRRAAKLKKKHLGTAGITSIGMKGKFGGWLTSLGGLSTTYIDIAGIEKKPAVINDEIKIRENLYLTVIVDHDIVDGSPAARFVERFVELIENGFGLDEI